MDIFKRIASIILRIVISIVLLVFLFKQIDKKNLLEIIKSADIPLLLTAFLVFFLNYALCLLRWQMLLKAVKIHLPLKRVIISYSGGIFFSLFLPSTIGGDFMRSLDLAAHTKKPKEVIATVLLDRLSGYIGLVFLALFSLVFGWRLIQDKSVLLCVAVLSAILIIILLVLFNKSVYSKVNRFLHSSNTDSPESQNKLSGIDKIRELMKSLHQEIHIFRHHKKIILENLIISLIIQTVTPLVFYVTALSLGLKIDIIYFFAFLPIIGAITLLPISLGGLGLRDATTIFFFAKAGIGRNLAFAMSLLNFFFILLYGALGGLIYVLAIHRRRLQHHKPSFI